MEIINATATWVTTVASQSRAAVIIRPLFTTHKLQQFSFVKKSWLFFFLKVSKANTAFLPCAFVEANSNGQRQ